MTHATFTYKTSASKDDILAALIQHLTLKVEDQTAFAALMTLENTKEALQKIDQNTLRNSEGCNFQLGQLLIRMDYTESEKMATMLQLYDREPQSYLPQCMQGPGTTRCNKIELYPVKQTANTQPFRIRCSPDYRSGIYLTEDQNYINGIQSLRFGYDFFCRALNQLMGEPEVKIEEYIISPQLQEELLNPQSKSESRLESFKKMLQQR